MWIPKIYFAVGKMREFGEDDYKANVNLKQCRDFVLKKVWLASEDGS